jgi:hypothetical protein
MILLTVLNCVFFCTLSIVWDSVSQTLIRGLSVVQGGSPGGTLLSAGSLKRKVIPEILSDTERMKNTPTHVCAKTTFVG